MREVAPLCTDLYRSDIKSSKVIVSVNASRYELEVELFSGSLQILPHSTGADAGTTHISYKAITVQSYKSNFIPSSSSFGLCAS